MNEFIEILERKLEDTFEVKNRHLLHGSVVFMAENFVLKSEYEKIVMENKSEIRLLAETMKEGFKAVDRRFEVVYERFAAIDKRFEDLYHYLDKRFDDMNKRFEDMNKRFEDMNKRFEDMNKRFNMMFTFMNIGFGIIILITILFKFMQ